MSDRLREASETWRRHRRNGTMPPQRTMNVLVGAARRFLALTETGPDYEAAAKVIYLAGEGNEQGWKTINTVDDPIFRKTVDRYNLLARKAVDAALADYLTEEETK